MHSKTGRAGNAFVSVPPVVILGPAHNLGWLSFGVVIAISDSRFYGSILKREVQIPAEISLFLYCE